MKYKTVITEYYYPNSNFLSLKLVDKTGEGFVIRFDLNFVVRCEGNVFTAYRIVLDDKELLDSASNSPFLMTNTLKLIIKNGYIDKDGNKCRKGKKYKGGYFIYEKDNKGTNKYFVDADNLLVTLIKC